MSLYVQNMCILNQTRMLSSVTTQTAQPTLTTTLKMTKQQVIKHSPWTLGYVAIVLQ